MLSKFKLNQLYFKDTQFANLMTRRIFNVLLIANPYDAFMLEDDGRIDEKIFNEYTSLSLRYPPRFTQVSTCEEALSPTIVHAIRPYYMYAGNREIMRDLT